MRARPSAQNLMYERAPARAKKCNFSTFFNGIRVGCIAYSLVIMSNVEDRHTSTVFERITNSDFIRKIKGIKNIKIIALVFIIAIALIIYSTVSIGKTEQETSVKSFATEDEARLADILSNVSGAGEVQTMITKSDGEIVGVLVIAEGASNPLVRIRLVDAVCGALGIEDDVICVLAKS